MMDAIKAMSRFFQQNSMQKTLSAFQIQIQQVIKDNIFSGNRPDLLHIISNALKQKQFQQSKKGRNKQNLTKQKKSYTLLSQQEIQNIIEKLMNKVLNSNKLMEIEKMKAQIAKLSKTKIFQKLIENTDIFNQIQQSLDSKHKSQFELSKTPTIKKEKVPIQLIKQSGLKRSPSIGDLQLAKNQTYDKNINQSNQIFQKGGPSFIQSQNIANQSSIISNPELVLQGLQQAHNQIDEYSDDQDIGYQIFEVSQQEFKKICKKIAQKYDYPKTAIIANSDKDPYKQIQGNNQSKSKQKQEVNKTYSNLPEYCKFPPSNDDFYPVQYQDIIYDCYSLKVIYNRQKTGFQQTKEFPIIINNIIGGRYQVLQFLGSAAFSKAIKVLDLIVQKQYCMKIIQNNKDYFDQSIDQIKLLKYINYNGDPDYYRVLRMYDYFYYKEHLFIVTQLLKDNLYQTYKSNRDNNEQWYFTIGRIQKISKQILLALDYIHKLHLIHADLKPQNILIQNFDTADIKVIDFGSTIFLHDRLSSYIQTRSYRAPEVIIGCKYDYKIDIWSFGCIIAQLLTGIYSQLGNVLFQNENVQGFLARVTSIVGPWPQWMLNQGKLVSNFMTKQKLIYHQLYDDNGQISQNNVFQNSEFIDKRKKVGIYQILVPKKTTLEARLKIQDAYFIDFVKWSLTIDPSKRASASQLLQHPFITSAKYPDGL